MSEQCVYPTIRFVAYNDRNAKQIFVPDPSLRGRYILTDRCVAFVACSWCKSIPGEPCKGKQGYHSGTHVYRRAAAQARGYRGYQCDDIVPEEITIEAPAGYPYFYEG